ncbi:MAG: septum site-determining protein MinC [Clostridia bacterium]|nr:septum site-determining protein MinC [Clostridia bacterium]
MTKDDLITIKGDRDGLHLFCQETALWSEVIAEIKERLTGEHQRFFAGASVIVEIGERNLAVEEVSTLWATLLECGVQIKGIKADTGEDSKATEKKSSFVSEKKISETEYLSQRPIYIMERNMRSGQNITFDGHVLVFGDVNPGAEIIAAGFIMVFGSLRGIAHAGATGDEKAWVMASRLQPTQLRIANCITRAPAEEPQGPEIAKIHEGAIICEMI